VNKISQTLTAFVDKFVHQNKAGAYLYAKIHNDFLLVRILHKLKHIPLDIRQNPEIIAFHLSLIDMDNCRKIPAQIWYRFSREEFRKLCLSHLHLTTEVTEQVISLYQEYEEKETLTDLFYPVL
jgi:hypothetical protein